MHKDRIKRLFEEIRNNLTIDSYYFKPLDLNKFQDILDQLNHEIFKAYELSFNQQTNSNG